MATLKRDQLTRHCGGSYHRPLTVYLAPIYTGNTNSNFYDAFVEEQISQTLRMYSYTSPDVLRPCLLLDVTDILSSILLARTGRFSMKLSDIRSLSSQCDV